MKSLNNNIISASIYLSFAAFGYVISRYFEIPHFELSKSIDPSNIITLIVTVWLAIIITTFFEKQNSNNRVEKDLIITRIGNLYDIADSLQLESNSGRIHITEASSSVKRINTALNSIYRIVGICHFNITDDLKIRLRNSLYDIRNTLTKTPSVSEELLNSKDLPIEIRDSMIHFNKDRIAELEVKFENLKDLLLELQIHINNT
jgi:hypothetical protein